MTDTYKVEDLRELTSDDVEARDDASNRPGSIGVVVTAKCSAIGEHSPGGTLTEPTRRDGRDEKIHHLVGMLNRDGWRAVKTTGAVLCPNHSGAESKPPKRVKRKSE